MPRGSRACGGAAKTRGGRTGASAARVAFRAGAAPLPLPATPPNPEHGSPILVLKKKWWNLIVRGRKTLEIRHQPLAPMRRYIGRSGQLWGAVTFDVCRRVVSDDQWRELLELHCWDTPSLPYTTTYALPVIRVEVFSCPVPYQMKPGQVGTATYEAPADFPAVRKRPAAQGHATRKKPSRSNP